MTRRKQTIKPLERIFIGVATFPKPPEIYEATDASLQALRWAGETETIYFGADDPARSKIENLTAKHNRMRLNVLDGGWDALLTVEADMIVPPDALEKLTSVDGDVVYGLYCSRHNGMWLCFEEIEERRGVALNATPARAKALWGQVIPSAGAGFGCTLIRRRVLERLEFRHDAAGPFADDWPFALDVAAAGFTQAHHLGVVCGHSATPGGPVLWPDPDAPARYRAEGEQRRREAMRGSALPVIAVYRVRKRLSGPRGDYLPGSTIELGSDAAAILLGRRAIEQIEATE